MSAQYSFEVVRGVSTKVLRFQSNLRLETDGIWRDFPIVVMIPGNPGEIQYYEEFLRFIYERFEEQVEVVGVSHTGHHSPPWGEYTMPALEENPQLYDLQAQILHKIEFIQRFIGFQREVILIGHSIGAYIAMQIMKREPRMKCEKAILLFPVFERILLTEKAQRMVKTVRRWESALLLLANLLHITPVTFKRWIGNWLYGRQHLGGATASFLCKNAIYASWFMAKDELDKVKEHDAAFIKRSWRLLSFYYGSNDQWCPLSYFEDMRRRYPQADITLCDKDIEHAFVLDDRSTRLMAEYAADKCKGVL